jgi:tetratricopeptide (TPR) repeat protein
LADALCIAHRYDKSVRQSQKTLELDPTFAIGHYELGQTYEQEQMHGEAIAELQKGSSFPDIPAPSTPISPTLMPPRAAKEEALKILAGLESRHEQNPSADANIALICAALGDQDRAMAWLNKAYEARFNPSILLRPAFDPLRINPHFRELRRRIGLPER